MILRADRFSRGGDQAPMQEAGYPAVRLTEADENYTRQHQDVRVEGGVSYGDVLERRRLHLSRERSPASTSSPSPPWHQPRRRRPTSRSPAP